MKFLKSELGQRHKEAASGSRDDCSMHPEELCDYDILVWRRKDQSHYNFRRDGDRHSWNNEGVSHVRDNDQAGMTRDPNTRLWDISNFSTTFLRTSL